MKDTGNSDYEDKLVREYYHKEIIEKGRLRNHRAGEDYELKAITVNADTRNKIT